MEHIFTASIKDILKKNFAKNADDIFDKSQLIQYINEKPVRQVVVQKQGQVLQICMQFM